MATKTPVELRADVRCTCAPGCDACGSSVAGSYAGTWRPPAPSCPCEGHTVWRIFYNRKADVGGRRA